MSNPLLVWTAAVIFGACAGFMAEMLGKRPIGIPASVIFGIAGALAITAGYSKLDLQPDGWSQKVVIVTVGAMLTVSMVRMAVWRLEALCMTLGWKLPVRDTTPALQKIPTSSF